MTALFIVSILSLGTIEVHEIFPRRLNVIREDFQRFNSIFRISSSEKHEESMSWLFYTA